MHQSSYGPRSAGYFPENELLTKRRTTVEDFRREMLDRWHKSRTTRASRDIPVPLRAGETFGQYKREFEKWLWTRQETMSSIQTDPVRERGFWFSYAHIRSGTVSHEAVGIGSKKRALQIDAHSYYGPAPVESKRQRADDPTPLPLTAQNLETSSGKGEKGATALKSDSSRPKSREHADTLPPTAVTATTPCHLEAEKAGNMPSSSTESDASPKNESALVRSMAHVVESSSQVEMEKNVCVISRDTELSAKEEMGATPSRSTPPPTKLCDHADTPLLSMAQGAAKTLCRTEQETEGGTPSTSPESDASPKNAFVSLRSTEHDVEISQLIEEEKGEEARAMSPDGGMGMEESRPDTPDRDSNAFNITHLSKNEEEGRRKEKNSQFTSSGPNILPPERRECEDYLPISRDEYLAQRVLSPEEYLKEIMELKQKRTGVPDERLPKIPVPLTPGETIADYEQSFITWISKRNQSLESLHTDPMKERGLRFQFALEKVYSLEANFDISPSKPNREARREEDPHSNTVEETASCATLLSPLARLADGNKIECSSSQNSATIFQAKLSNASTTWISADAIVRSRSSGFKTVGKSSSARATEIIPGWAAKLVARVQELEAKVERLELEIDSYRAAAGIQGSSSGGDQSGQRTKACTEGDVAEDLRQPSQGSNTLSTQTTETLVAEDCGNKASHSETTGEQAKIRGEKTANDKLVPATTSKRNERAVNQVEARARLMEMYTTSSADILRDGMIGLTEAVQSRVKDNQRKQKLTKAYTHLNDQIILNETAISDAIAYVRTIKAADEAVAMEQQNQIMELVVSVNKEKEKRSAALAAVTMQHWTGRKSDLSSLVDAKPSEDTRRGPTHENLAALLSRMDKAKSILEEQETKLSWYLQVVSAIPTTVRDIPRALRFSALQKMTAQIRRELAMKQKLETDLENLLSRFVARDDQVRKSVAEMLDGARQF